MALYSERHATRSRSTHALKVPPDGHSLDEALAHGGTSGDFLSSLQIGFRGVPATDPLAVPGVPCPVAPGGRHKASTLSTWEAKPEVPFARVAHFLLPFEDLCHGRAHGQVLPKQVGDFGSVGIEAGVGVGHVESAGHLMPEGFPKESVEFPVGVHRYLLDKIKQVRWRLG